MPFIASRCHTHAHHVSRSAQSGIGADEAVLGGATEGAGEGEVKNKVPVFSFVGTRALQFLRCKHQTSSLEQVDLLDVLERSVECRVRAEDHRFGFQFRMSLMGGGAPSSTARLTRNRRPSEETAYCCLLAPGSGPPAMRTGNRAAGVPRSSDWPFGDNFTGTAIILPSSDT